MVVQCTYVCIVCQAEFLILRFDFGEIQMFKSANPTSLINANSLKWELPALYSAAILSSQQQVSVDHHISRETSSLLEKEVATPKQVSFNHLCIIQIV